MGFFLLVLKRDYLVLPRQKYFYWRRIALLAIVGLILSGLSYFTPIEELSKTIFMKFNFFMLLTACMFTPIMASIKMSREMENKAIGILSMSEVPLWIAFLGTFTANFGLFVITLIALLPVVVMSHSTGVELLSILQIFLVILSSAFLSCSYGSLSAILFREKRKRTFFLTMGLIGFYLIPMLAAVPSAFNVNRLREDIYYLESSRDVYIYLGWTNTIGLFCLFLCLALIRRRLYGDKPVEKRDTLLAKFEAWGFNRFKSSILNYEIRHAYGGFSYILMKFIVLTGTILIALIALGRSIEDAFWTTYGFWAIYVFFAALIYAGKAFDDEFHHGKQFELLLLSSLDPTELVQSKIRGIIIATSPYWISLVLINFVAAMYIAAMADGISEAALVSFLYLFFMLAISLFFLSLLYFAVQCGINYSLKSGKAGLIVVPVGGLLYLFLSSIIMTLSFCIFCSTLIVLPAFATLNIVFGRLIQANTIESFRRAAAKRLQAQNEA